MNKDIYYLKYMQYKKKYLLLKNNLNYQEGGGLKDWLEGIFDLKLKQSYINELGDYYLYLKNNLEYTNKMHKKLKSMMINIPHSGVNFYNLYNLKDDIKRQFYIDYYNKVNINAINVISQYNNINEIRQIINELSYNIEDILNVIYYLINTNKSITKEKIEEEIIRRQKILSQPEETYNTNFLNT